MEEPDVLDASKKDETLYRKLIQDKIREELEKLQHAEEQFKIKIQEENRRKKEREEMKKKVLEEIEAIKALEIQKAAELAREEEERKRREVIEQEEREKRKADEEEREKERRKVAEEIAEARRLSEEARKAAERRERIRLEAEQHKREAEEARRKAFEAERLRLMTLEEEERQVKLAEQKKAREEEERRIGEAVLERRKRDLEMEKRAREEMEAQRQRDQEELRLQMLESKKRKFEREEEERKRRDEEERDKMYSGRRKKSENPLLMRFEEISQQQQKKAEDEAASRTRQKKPHPAKFTRKIESKAEVLRQSKVALAAAISRGALNNVRCSSKELIKAVSKEFLKVLSKESLKKKSRTSLVGKSRENLIRIGSVKNIHATSSRQDLTTNQPSKNDMQSYLISHVLFDGKEDVQLTKHGKGSHRHLAGVEEEVPAQEVLISSPKEESEDRMFEAYKQEMEKYLSCFTDESHKKGKTVKKVKTKKVDLDKKPILNIGTIRNQFESLASPEINEAEEVPKVKPNKRVGKLETVKLFEERKVENETPIAKKEYVPVVIDKDAFERTMGRFEHYKDEEEERERRREEQKRKKLEEERLRMEREKEEMEQKFRAEEEAKRRMKEEEEAAARRALQEQQEEREKKRGSVMSKIGNFFSGKGNESQKEPSPVKEVDPVEQERLRRMDIHARIQFELEKIRELEEKQRQQIERERKKQELKRMIQQELDKIKGLDTGKKADDEDMPLWMRMVYDPEARKKYMELKHHKPDENVKQSTSEEKKPEQTEEGTPKWVQMVKERQEALQKAKEQMEIACSDRKEEVKKEDMKKMRESLLDLSKVCKDSQPSFQQDSSIELTTSKELDSRPPMTFEESVQAMIDLLEEDKKWSENKSKKSKLMSKKKENVILPNVSDVRNLFENLETSPGQPTSPASPSEINQERVKQAKQQLLQQKEKESTTTGQSKIDVLVTKKCSTIKSMFERTKSTTDKEEKTKPKPKKSIVQVIETPSIDEQLAEKKRQLAVENKWSYKEKSLRDLHQIFSSGQNSVTSELAQKAESVLEKSKRVEAEEAKRNADKQQELDEYNALMDQIHQFVESSDKMGKTDEEIAFQYTLTGYLQLIEEDNEYRKSQDQNEKTKTTKKNKKEVKKVPKKFSEEIFSQENSGNSNSTEQPKPKNVKKLDLSKFTSNVEKEEILSAPKREANSYNCDIIKEHLEKRTAQPDISGPIQRKMKLVNIEEPLSVTQSLAQLKAKREQEWKWKQKTIGELQDYLHRNQSLAKNMVENAKAEDEETAKRKKALESMLAKRQQLKEATNQRDEEFEKFMSDLEHFSQEPSTDKSDEIFKTSVKSYLQLIDKRKKREENEIALPEINLPSRLEDLKSRITEKDFDKGSTTAKKPMTIKKIQSFFGKSESSTKDDDKSTQDKELAQTLSPGKATKLKKMFEEKPKLSGMMRTRSELTLQEKPVKKSKHLIELTPIEPSPLQMLPLLSRRNSVKSSWSNRVSSYFSSPAQDNSVPAYKSIEQRLDTVGAKSRWDDISDPEERKKAILAKHGFKPQVAKQTSTNIDDVDTIPEHILRDEVLYRRYMKEQISMEDDSSRDSSSPEPDNKRDPKGGSFSSLMNILNTMKKTSMQKNALESRKRLDDIAKQGYRQSSSELDLSAVPGSCSNLKNRFEMNENFNPDKTEREDLQGLAKSTSCSNLRSLWETHMLQTDNNVNNVNSNKPCPQPLNIEALRESLLMSSKSGNYNPKDSVEPGELTSEAFKYFSEQHSRRDEMPNLSAQNRLQPLKNSIAALRESLMASSTSTGGSSSRAKELFESGEFTSEAIRQFTEQRSVVGKDSNERYDFERQKRKLFSKLSGTNRNTEDDDDDDDEDEDRNQGGGGVHSELEALRSSGQVKSLFRLQHGRGEPKRVAPLRRSLSSNNFDLPSLGGASSSTDLDDETMAELSVSNSMIRAMFESSAPKYKFGGVGGSNENVSSTKKDVPPLRPVMRPSQKTKEERLWVLDTINKYFDVIVEEEDEEEKEDVEDDEDDSIGNGPKSLESSSESLYESADEDESEEEVNHTDNHAGGSNFRSTARIRGLLETAVKKVITNSQTNLVSTIQNDKKKLIGNLKENLGSQISLKRQMSYDHGLNYA